MAQKYHLIKCLIDKCAMLHEANKFLPGRKFNAEDAWHEMEAH